MCDASDTSSASAPGLSIPASIAFQTFHKQGPTNKEKHKHSTKSKAQEILLHSREHPAINYTAREHPTGSDAHLTKHYVAVYDPQTGELQVVEARKMDVRSSLRIEDEQLREKEKQESVGFDAYTTLQDIY